MPEDDPKPVFEREKHLIKRHRVRPHHTPANVATVVEMTAAGKNRNEVAKVIGVNPSTVSLIANENRDLIRQRQENVAKAVLERLDDEKKKWLEVSMETIEKGGERTAPQLLRVIGELGGSIGKGNTTIMGDVNVSKTVTVNDERKQLIVSSSKEENEAELERLKDELGLA